MKLLCILTVLLLLFRAESFLQPGHSRDGLVVRQARLPPTESLQDITGTDGGSHTLDDSTITSRRFWLGSSLISAGTLLGGRDALAATEETSQYTYQLPWEANPINKRFGKTVKDAETKGGYTKPFVTYLARFLLNFDSNCQQWWFRTNFPSGSDAETIEKLRLEQFASFSASVEVGLLQNYNGKADALLNDLVQRYGNESETTSLRLARSARRHIALLFGLLESSQPVKELTKLLASVDNGRVKTLEMNQGTFRGYASAPGVVFPPPPSNGTTAQGRAVMAPTGQLLSIKVVDPGSGYTQTPPIRILSFNGTEAKIQVVMKDGGIDKVKLQDGGSGYYEEPNVVVLPPPEGGRIAVLKAVLDQEIVDVQITNQGSGYAVEKPLKIKVGDKVIATATPTADVSSFTGFRKDADKQKIKDLEVQFEERYELPTRTVNAVRDDSSVPPLPFWSGKSVSSQLLKLLPAGIGLEYDFNLKRYVLAVDGNFMQKYPNAIADGGRPLGLEFGPRGRAPIERDMELGLAQYLRFGLSGAICASGVHLVLTPLDVAKTKIQTNPSKYKNIRSSFSVISKEEGASTFFTGWLPTLLGNFVMGGVLYSLTEIIRRYLSEVAGIDAANLEVPIILTAAAVASAIGAILICPFEAVRIRSVAQPDYGENAGDVLSRMLEEEGVASLVNAIPVFLVRNVPYAMTKFTIFDLSTERLSAMFPSAQEELKLSLLVSLVGGILGGSAAAVVSNPADAVISELKKAKSDITFQEAISNMLDRAGPSTFFVGLPLRMVFYSLIASLTFVVYDSVRFALGIGPDDLKLYLDVLGGALRDTGNA